MTDHDQPPIETTFNPVAGLAAVAFPGAGHLVLGQTWRGLHAAAGILGLFITGLLIGGIGVIDSRVEGWWFVGQALVGPITFGLDAVHQHVLKQPLYGDHGPVVTPGPDQHPTYIPPLGKPAEIGTLFTAVAGMINVIVIVDAAFPYRRRSSTSPAHPTT